MTELLNQILSLVDRGQALAICYLVRTHGSTPQKAGAIMVVLPDGKTLGTIGGGCVEAEVRSKALQFFAMSKPASESKGRLLSFKLDHELGWDDGLICGGVMDVVVQILTSPDQAENLRQVCDQLYRSIEIELHLSAIDEQGVPREFQLPFEPSPTLVIAGAGHVGAALAEIASRLDFRVIVIDDRPDMVSPQRFPLADRRIANVEDELRNLDLTRHSFVVIVTRGHRRDAAALAAVIASEAAYIGLIGSKRKIVRIFSDLAEQGVITSQLRRVHAPIGLDIGAVTPTEIAVAIASELIAVRRGSAGEVYSSMRLSENQIERLGLETV